MKKVQRVEALFELLRVVLGLVIAYIITLVLIILTSDVTPQEVITNFVLGPFTTPRRFGQLMGKFIPYVLGGCGMCFIYGCGRFNLVGEGIVNFAPAVACIVLFNTPIFNHVPWIVGVGILLIICCAVGGGLAMIPAIGREKLKISEMVTSIIMNYMLLYLSLWFLKSLFADRSQAFLCSPMYPENGSFFQLIPGTNLHAGIFVSIIGWVVACLMFDRMRIGVKLRICGSNGMFAKYSGLNTTKIVLIGQLIGGIYAGAAACVDAFGMYTRYQYSVLTNIGMDALVVAVIARKKPIYVPLAAFVLAYIRTSAVVLNLSTNIPIEFVNMMQAVLILFVAAQHFLQKSKEKAIYKISMEESKEKGAVV